MKVSICVPHHGDVKAGFAKCLAELVGYSTSKGISTSVRFEEAGPLDYKRNKLAAAAKADGSDYAQWIDSDQTFPADGLERLLSANRPIIGGNYPNRHFSTATIATSFGMDGRKLARGRGIENVRAMGLGFCLVRMDVFDKIPRPWFIGRYDGEVYTSEDVHFCNQARICGIPVAVDHDLVIGHIAERVLTLDAP